MKTYKHKYDEALAENHKLREIIILNAKALHDKNLLTNEQAKSILEAKEQCLELLDLIYSNDLSFVMGIRNKLSEIKVKLIYG